MLRTSELADSLFISSLTTSVLEQGSRQPFTITPKLRSTNLISTPAGRKDTTHRHALQNHNCSMNSPIS